MIVLIAAFLLAGVCEFPTPDPWNYWAFITILLNREYNITNVELYN